MRQKMNDPVTMDDIARLAGVARSTVSRVLNNSQSTSARTREKVLNVIREQNYVPNYMASQLGKKHSNTIAVMIEDIQNQYFAEILKAIENASIRLRYFPLVCARFTPERESYYLKEILQRRCTGILFVSCQVSDFDMIRQLHQRQIPMVGLQTHLPDAMLIDSDDRLGTKAVIEHLISLGHRHIAYLTSDHSTYVLNERLRGYQDALAEHGIDPDPSLVYRFNDQRNSYDTTLSILSAPKRPTAIHCQNDHEALSAYIAITSTGLRIPEDISLSGYDNLPNSRLIRPQLTTVEQPLQRMGMAAMDLLDDMIKDPASYAIPRQIVYPTQLVVRGSTGAPSSLD